MKKKIVRSICAVTAAAALCVCGYCVWYIVQYYKGVSAIDQMRKLAYTDGGENQAGDNFGAKDGAQMDSEDSENGSDTENPIDFDSLTQINTDIYAWLEIPGTSVSYALVQNEEDNTYYLTHNEQGDYFSGGSIFSENYNSTDLTDRITVLYGHNMKNGSMFAQLNDFGDAEFFESHRYLYIYTPQSIMTYEIFAAYPHSREHLLLNYDFDDEQQYNDFFDEVYSSRDMRAHFIDGYRPDYAADKIVTLSTCLQGNNRQRFLVQAVLISTVQTRS